MNAGVYQNYTHTQLALSARLKVLEEKREICLRGRERKRERKREREREGGNFSGQLVSDHRLEGIRGIDAF